MIRRKNEHRKQDKQETEDQFKELAGGGGEERCVLMLAQVQSGSQSEKQAGVK